MRLTTENRLIFNHFKNIHQYGTVKKVLNLSQQPIPFCMDKDIKVKLYFERNCCRLPFPDHSYDFVFNREISYSKMFISPLIGLTNLTRVSRTGVIQQQGILDIFLLGRHSDYITWTDNYNRMCVLPNIFGDIFIKNRTKWLDLVNFNPIYLNNYYIWKHPLEASVQSFFCPDLDDLSYHELIQLINEAVEQSVENTRKFIESNQDPKDDEIFYM